MRLFNQPEREHEMVLMVRMLEIIAGLGLLICAGNIANTEGDISYIVYASWFAVAIASFEAIVNWYKLGVYALVLATGLVTVMELTSGTASLGGASLALILFALLYVYIAPVWARFE